MRALAIALCLLATPTLADVAGEGLGAWMVSQGLALAYRRYSLDYVDEETDAQAARRGIWASEFVPPWEWRRGKRLDAGD